MQWDADYIREKRPVTLPPGAVPCRYGTNFPDTLSYNIIMPGQTVFVYNKFLLLSYPSLIYVRISLRFDKYVPDLIYNLPHHTIFIHFVNVVLL